MSRTAAARTHAAAVALTLFGFAISAVLWFAVAGAERHRERLQFEMRAGHVAQAVRAGFDIPLEALQSIPALFASSETVTRSEFRVFVAGTLARHPSIYAFEWLPLVPGKEREAYEQLARSEGIADFQFKDDLGGGRTRVSPQRPEYLPIYFMEPTHPTPLGFDVASEPARRAPADQSRDAGRAIASVRIRLVEDPPEVYSIAVFRPVYLGGSIPATIEQRRAAVRGYAVEVFRVGPVVQRALQDTDVAGMDLALVDDEAPPDMRVLYESRAGVATASPGRLVLSQALPYAGRSWTLTASARPTVGFFSPRPLTVFGAGLAISVLLGAVLGALRTIFRLRKQVDAALQLGQYTLDHKLGAGGMGVVYTARHAMLRRPTAIKLLPAEDAGGTRTARFEREAQLTSQLTHPNTIAVYDYGCTPEGVFYYAMEYIDGITLQELVTLDGAQPAGRVLHLLRQVCGSLAEAHGIGLIHRDIKPANIMLSTRAGIADFVKVLDFGLAREIERGQGMELSTIGAAIGTPLYLSPEAIQDPESIDARTDIYALGGVAYYLVTGEHVFDGHSTVELCSRHLYATPVPPSKRTTQPVPPCLESIILRCLAKDREQRPASAAELLRELDACPDVPEWTGGEAWWRDKGRAICTRAAAERGQQEVHEGRAFLTTVAARGGAG